MRNAVARLQRRLRSGGGHAELQVAHRMLAYTVAALALALLVLALRGKGPRLAGSLPLLAVLVQTGFGIAIVLVGGDGRAHEILAGLHVGGAGAVWAALVALAALARPAERRPAAARSPSRPGERTAVLGGVDRHVTGARLDLERRPILVFWEMTRACLLACRHCRASAIAEPLPGELSTEEGERFLESLTGFGRPYPVLVLTGGDVLMRPDLLRLVRKARELGLHAAVSPSVTPRLEPPRSPLSVRPGSRSPRSASTGPAPRHTRASAASPATSSRRSRRCTCCATTASPSR